MRRKEKVCKVWMNGGLTEDSWGTCVCTKGSRKVEVQNELGPGIIRGSICTLDVQSKNDRWGSGQSAALHTELHNECAQGLALPGRGSGENWNKPWKMHIVVEGRHFQVMGKGLSSE